MSSFYSVIQYVPDPRIDERINIGVTAFGEGRVVTQFLTNWERVSRFADEDISFLREFAKELSTPVEDGTVQAFQELANGGAFDEAMIRQIANGWKNSIQFTAPRASLRDVEELKDTIAKKFLREPTPRVRNRGRRTAARLAAGAVKQALEEHLGPEGTKLVRRDYEVPGAHEGHEFDVVVFSDGPRLATHAISFEIKASKQLEQLVDATLWAVDDVKTLDPEFPVAVATLPPRNHRGQFDRAQRLFTELGASFVSEDELPAWADETTEHLELPLAVAG